MATNPQNPGDHRPADPGSQGEPHRPPGLPPGPPQGVPPGPIDPPNPPPRKVG
jgi:hypothetical protein